jgi:predicted secreted hydrolase
LRKLAKNTKFITICLCLVIVAAGPLAIAEDNAEYLSVTRPCNLELPKDHGPHPGYRTEWWYYTGNLSSEKGNRYGFQFTIFRTQISPPGFEKKWPQPSSAWRTLQIYLGHAAISDISGKRHVQDERVARAALGLAGGVHKDGNTEIFVNTWSLQIASGRHLINQISDDFAFELILIPDKPPVMHGDEGYSRKGSTPHRASCYYSFTRLNTKGTLTTGGHSTGVEGTSWMDHEYSTAVLEPGLVGWDWFSLQLSDNTEIMFFLLREDDGSVSPVSSGSFIDASGSLLHLDKDDFKVDVLKTWKSPGSRTVYPARWRVQVHPLFIDLTVFPNLADQEMQTLKSTGVTYWEGSVGLKGTKQGQAIKGQGYVELTGYAGSFDAPM